MGFGFASAGLIIIFEIISAKFTMGLRTQYSLCSILLLLTLSSTLVAVTIWMIDTYYSPKKYTCHLVNEQCEWEYQKENMSWEPLNISEI